MNQSAWNKWILIDKKSNVTRTREKASGEVVVDWGGILWNKENQSNRWKTGEQSSRKEQVGAHSQASQLLGFRGPRWVELPHRIGVWVQEQAYSGKFDQSWGDRIAERGSISRINSWRSPRLCEGAARSLYSVEAGARDLRVAWKAAWIWLGY